MPSQPNSGIPLSHLPNEAGYKLLELPPELLELFEGQDPPRLTLHPSTSAALLKTPLKTYSLRQKNTSNALILLAPTTTTTTTTGIPTSAAPDTDSNDGADKDPSPIARAGISTIATVHETVELVPEAEAAAAPAAKARGRWHEKFGRGR